MDSDSNYYAMYRVIQYQATDKEYSFVFWPSYKEVAKNIWAFDQENMTVIAVPNKPTFKDLYRFVQKKEFMRYKLTDKERELIRNNYLRKKT